MTKLSLLLWPLLATLSGGAQTLNHYYGNIHSHSSYSDGNQDSATSHITTPLQDFNYARQSQHIDFYGISDHNHSQAGMYSPSLYHRGVAQANAANNDGTFVALYGMEWGVISGGGHVLVYGCDSLMGWESNNYDVYVARSDYRSLWKAVNRRNGAFAYLAHPATGDYNNLLTTALSQSADNAIVGLAARSGPANSTNSSYSNPTSSTNISDYNNALKQGYHLGVGLDHDTHNSVFGRQSAGRLVVLAPSLTRANILDGIRHMRIYSSDDWNVRVNFTINNFPIGSDLMQAGAPALSVSVSDPDGEAVSSISIYYGIPGSGANPTVLNSVSSSSTLSYTHTAAANNSKYYYYARVIQQDGNTIWTSPIWYNRNDAILSAAPVAAFSTSDDTLCIGQSLALSDNSFNNPSSWQWSMPGANPSSSTQETAVLSYPANGVYTVSLVSSNASGSSNSVSKTIVVNSPPTPSISVNGDVLTSSSATGNQWYRNNNILPGATAQSYTASVAGVYYVIVRTSSSCSAISSTLNVVPTGLAEQEAGGTNLRLYPNPAEGWLSVETSDPSLALTAISIFNPLGERINAEVIQVSAGSYRIDLNGYATGIYLLRLNTSSGIVQRKFMLNK